MTVAEFINPSLFSVHIANFKVLGRLDHVSALSTATLQVSELCFN